MIKNKERTGLFGVDRDRRIGLRMIGGSGRGDWRYGCVGDCYDRVLLQNRFPRYPLTDPAHSIAPFFLSLLPTTLSPFLFQFLFFWLLFGVISGWIRFK